MLGLAAIASSIARPPDPEGGGGGDTADTVPDDETATGTTSTPTAAPVPGSPEAEAVTLRFPAAGEPRTRRLEQGRPATLLVAVDEPAQVDIPTLGLNQPAEPLTPARFDVLIGETGTHAIELLPVAPDGEAGRGGTLKVVPAS